MTLISHVVLVAEGEDDRHVIFELLLSLEGGQENVTGNSILVRRANGLFDDPKNFSDIFHRSRHCTILWDPDRNRHSEVEKTWSVCQNNFLTLPVGIDWAGQLSAAPGFFTSREDVLRAVGQRIQDSALAYTEWAKDKNLSLDIRSFL